jgi:hypothetical protein
MGKGGSVEEGARDLVGPLAARKKDRLVTSWRRLVLHQCLAGGDKKGLQSHRSWVKEEQAPPRDRLEQHSARRHADWLQRTRRCADTPASGCDTGCAW